MRIGILGGTFDPPHAGHLALAHAAADQLLLDEVLFLPANKNPFKKAVSSTAPKHRVAMVQRMVAQEPGMALSDMEITRGGVSYTVDTLGELQMVRPAEYWFILGADAVKGLSEWRNPQRLLRLCRLAVAIRPPESEDRIMSKIPEEFREKVDMVQMKPLDVSSTDLRERLARSANVTPWIAPAVMKYIQENKLYRG
jgi:nicotinate-nucleotide adenylyltransferase